MTPEMTPERRRQLEEIFHAALSRVESERIAFLADTCAGDDALRQQVESLLAQQASTGGILDRRALAAAAQMLSDTGASISILTGRRLGAYQVHERIGVGGMGEVYRARDTKLGRDVAIKILPRLFTSDPDRLARFEREARVLASLNHPHIGAIYGLEDADGVRALVLELVNGETLAARIARGAIPLPDALTITQQIADALDAAHEKGIVHRDLKPANIKITPDGHVKVLDFGLAKAAMTDGAGDLSRSQIVTVAGSFEGMILGTAAYMSPEQARGKPVDKRADIWALGVIVYEMLTGNPMFTGETASETMALVMTKAPDWSALPSNTPRRVRELLRRALTVDPRARLQSIGEARITIEEEIAHPQTESGALSKPRGLGKTALPWAATALLGVIALIAFWAPWRTASHPARTVRFDVFAPDGARIAPGHPLSPDGRTLAFVADSEGTPLIWVRPLDSSVAQPLPGTEGAAGIFWSPDSQYIGFFAQGRLKKVATRGGPPLLICNVERGPEGAWGTDNVILIGEIGEQPKGLMRVAAAGGQPTPATEFSGKESHHFPSFLPDGRHFLYLARSGPNYQEHLWYVGSLDAKERYPLPGLTGQLGAVTYSPTGHVLFVRGVTLMAQPFDLGRLELSGDAVPIAEQTTQTFPEFSVSSNGSLAYLNGGVDSELAWFDRTGRQLGLAGKRGQYRNPELSLDGKFVAFSRGQPPDLWVRDIERGLDTRLTSHAAADHTPIWSPDMRNLAFFSARQDGTLFVLAVGGMGEGTVLLESQIGPIPADWSRDGRHLIYQFDGDVWALPYPANNAKPVRVTQTRFRESNPRLSPDGQWIAYTSDQSGERADVYVQPFLQSGPQQQVSIAGGQTPRWSADGKELFYIAPDFGLMAVPIARAGSSLRVGTPIRLFQTRMSTGGLGRNYNVAADGRFLINVTTDLAAAPLTVVLNWDALLK